MPQHEKLFRNKLWQQCYEDFLHHLGNISGSKATPRDYNSVLHNFFTCPTRTPDVYSRPEIEQFLRTPMAASRFHKPKASVAPATYNLRLCALRSFYAYAAEYDVPFRNGQRPLLHTPNPMRNLRYLDQEAQPREISAQDFRAIINAIPRDTVRGLRDRAIILCYFWTARRRSEIASLAWGNLEERDGVHYYTFVRKGKARKLDRAELPQPAWQAIKDYLIADGRWGNLAPDDAIFANHNQLCRAGQGIHGGQMVRILKKYAKKAGVSVDLRLHDLRHMAAQERDAANGHDVLKIQELLRHENLNTTMIYLKRGRRERDVDAVKLFDRFGDL